MSRQLDTSVPISEAIQRLQPGDHLCLIHETKAEGLAAAISFVASGLEGRCRCLCIVDGELANNLAEGLGREGADAALSSGALIIQAGRELFREDGAFSPELMLGFLQESSELAAGDGYRGLRIINDMTWVLEGESDAGKLIEYEVKLEGLLSSHLCTVMCLYNRQRFSEAAIRDVVRAHALIASPGRAAGNPLFAHGAGPEAEGAEPTDADHLLTAILERNIVEDARRVSLKILAAANLDTDLQVLLDEFVVVISDYTGCRAVGIRLLDEEGNIPYQACTGFSESFYQRESPLSVMRDECMCINVIIGRTDPEQPFYTKGGSFFMNTTTKFLATVSQEAKGNTRNACNESGYESVALIPLRKGREVIGLIHLADTREHMVPAGAVEVLEDVAVFMGNAIQRIRDDRKVRESLEEKEVLLREVHHRVKNNLATILGLLNLHRKDMQDPGAVDTLAELGSRIKSMALIHEFLYRSESLSKIDFQEYLKALVSHLRTTFGPGSSMRIRVEASVHMSLDDAMPCGMIINELVTNALKYAFPGRKARRDGDFCEISVGVAWDGDAYTVTVADNGIGMPAGLSIDQADTLGLRLVRMLGQHQLGGDMNMDSAEGTRFSLRFTPRQRR